VKSVAASGFLGRSSEHLFPYGIYTIPEISMIGKTEAQLTAEGVPYEIGLADFTVSCQ
jgi:NAD(P) transhydrogenase